MHTTLIRGATLVNEGQEYIADVYIKDGRIWQIGANLGIIADQTIEAQGQFLLPGVIDDQVHFREPGLTHKGRILTESRAAVAGGTTSYMEMPNTKPAAVTHALLEEKYTIAARDSYANYSFYLGVSNDNLQEVLKTDPARVCGIKIFLGSSTGDLLVDDPAAVETLFRECPMLIAAHCEYEPLIRANTEAFRARYGADMPMREHANLRSAEACYRSSSFAVGLAKQYGTRLHVLHISTAQETALFEPGPVAGKRITAEACTHHLWFTDADYDRLGGRIKWNPAIKTLADREGIWLAVQEGRIDLLATDHAPHTLAEKALPYFDCPSGGPLVQHSLLAGFAFVQQGRLSITRLVELMCHNPATLFRVQERGYLRQGYWADLVLVDPAASTLVTPASLHYHCGWSPFEGETLPATITHTFVNGGLVYKNGQFDAALQGQRLAFTA